MRVAFCGKGGSGKTTLASSFASWLVEQRKCVLAIDADLNQHMGAALGLSEDTINNLPELGSDQDILKSHVRGNNPLIPSNDQLVKTSPPYRGSGFINLKSNDNPVLDYYAYQDRNFQFIRIGGFHDEDIGTSCYHAKTGALELLLNYTLDQPEDNIVVDMTAGADSFASGLFTRFDLTVLVVEPTLRSLSVVDQYHQYAQDYDVNLKIVGNKVSDEEDRRFLVERLGDDLIGFFNQSRWIRNKDRGVNASIKELEDDNQECLQQLYEAGTSIERNWDRYWAQAIAIHKKNAESWANAMTGVDLTKQIRHDFLKKLCA